jgi:hypothetical protein
MILTQAIPAVWVYTTATSFNSLRSAGYAAFLSDDQKARLERIRQSRLLYQGKHRSYFLDEQRSQFDFPVVRAGDRKLQMYLTLNVLKLISKKSADLLFGQEPLLRVDQEIQQAKLSALAERTNLHKRLYNAAVEGSAEGETFLECCVVGGQVYVRRVPNDQIFGDGPLGPDDQYARYVGYQLQNVGTAQAPLMLLLETVWLAGSIERHVWQLDGEGRKLAEVALDQWPTAAAEGLAPLVRTGISRNTITWVPNETELDIPVSDYDGLVELQDELNAKQTQIGRVLAKHSDPKLGLPESFFDPAGNVRSDHDAFPFRTKDELPTYITWNAELAHAIGDRQFTLNSLLITAETSPVLLGLKEGAAPDAYKKVRLEAQNSLTKAQRKAANWKPGVKRLLDVAQDLEQTLPGVRYDRVPVAVEMRDGIPADDEDQANTVAIYRSAGVMSVERAVELQLIDKTAVAKEVQQIKDEAADKTPPIFFGGGMGGTEPGETPPAQSGAAGAAGDRPAPAANDQREGVAA